MSLEALGNKANEIKPVVRDNGNVKSYDPDRRIDKQEKALSPDNAKGYDPDKRINTCETNKIDQEKKQDIPQVVQNKQDGCRRENEVAGELAKRYPIREGYSILRERELCDKEGNPVIDDQTGQKRRIDFVVVKDGHVVEMVEVTSKTAPKRDQMAKEYRIRAKGGNYIKDSAGNVCRIPNNVETKIERRD